jgi:hypothetical protein
VNYDLDNCPEDEEKMFVGIHQATNGEFKTFEYKKLGIIVKFNNGNPTEINFVDHSLGPVKSNCAKMNSKKKK